MRDNFLSLEQAQSSRPWCEEGGRRVGRQGEGQYQWWVSLCVLSVVAAPLRSGGHTPGSFDDSFVYAWRAAMSQACRLSWQLCCAANKCTDIHIHRHKDENWWRESSWLMFKKTTLITLTEIFGAELNVQIKLRSFSKSTYVSIFLHTPVEELVFEPQIPEADVQRNVFSSSPTTVHLSSLNYARILEKQSIRWQEALLQRDASHAL